MSSVTVNGELNFKCYQKILEYKPEIIQEDEAEEEEGEGGVENKLAENGIIMCKN